MAKILETAQTIIFLTGTAFSVYLLFENGLDIRPHNAFAAIVIFLMTIQKHWVQQNLPIILKRKA